MICTPHPVLFGW